MTSNLSARRGSRGSRRRFAVDAGGILIGVLFMLPILWLVIASITPGGSIGSFPPEFFPENPSLANYFEAFDRFNFGRFFWNSVIIASASTLLVVLFGAPAAYGLARTKAKGRTTILVILLIMSIFPIVTVLTPLYTAMSALGWLNSYQALIIPYTSLNLPFAVWVMRNNFLAIAPEMEEAARIDGASELRAVWSVILPQALPGIFVAAVLTFVACWQEFLLALSFNSNAEYQTAPVGIALFGGSFIQPYGTIFAASVVALLPIAFVVVALRRWVIGGISQGAVKG